MDGAPRRSEPTPVPLGGSELARDGAPTLARYVRQYEAMPRSLCTRVLEELERHSDQLCWRVMDGVRRFQDWSLDAAVAAEPELRPLRDAVLGVIESVVDRYRRDVGVGPYDWPAAHRLENLRVKRYRRGEGFFEDHVDVRNYQSARRFLVVFVYLDDVEEGGRTEFRDLGTWAQPVAGRALVFPPTWMFPHRGQVPLSGDKHIVGTYLHYV